MRYDVPVFDPFGDRGDDYFHPNGEAASLLMHIIFTYRDIERLFSILNRTDDDYDAKHSRQTKSCQDRARKFGGNAPTALTTSGR